jgi:hypothetical protein
VIIVDVLVDLVVDNNLIFFVASMHKDAGFIPALSFPHKEFAVLNSSEQNAQSAA